MVHYLLFLLLKHCHYIKEIFLKLIKAVAHIKRGCLCFLLLERESMAMTYRQSYWGSLGNILLGIVCWLLSIALFLIVVAVASLVPVVNILLKQFNLLLKNIVFHLKVGLNMLHLISYWGLPLLHFIPCVVDMNIQNFLLVSQRYFFDSKLFWKHKDFLVKFV